MLPDAALAVLRRAEGHGGGTTKVTSGVQALSKTLTGMPEYGGFSKLRGTCSSREALQVEPT